MEAGRVAAGKDATRKLARHVATLPFEALPPAVVEHTKYGVLDTLGVSIGASSLAPEGKLVADYVKEISGRPESTILGFGGKAPAPWAAFVNGALGHMLDYDDFADACHVSIATVPVAFAIAEKVGGVSGRALIAAIACGTDLMTRLHLSIDIPDWTLAEGWFPSQLFGFMSGAATASRLLGLDEERMENALGIAFNQISGSRQMAVGAATHMRSMQTGFSGQGAILAALLAQRGIIGSKEIVEGRYGLYKTYVRTDTPNWEALLGGLGSSFPMQALHGFKVWPACNYTRATNAATLQLRQEFNLHPEDVEAITVISGSAGVQLLSEPLELKRRPKSSVDGKYSIPFTTAVMMVKGNVTLRDYTDAGLREPSVLAMADRVSYRAPCESKDGNMLSSASPAKTVVQVSTKDGRVLVGEPGGLPGDPQNAVDCELLETKFRDCVSFSAKPIAAKSTDRAIQMIRELENVPDVTEIIRLLA